MKRFPYKYPRLRLVIATCILLSLIVLTPQLIKLSRQQQTLKTDLAELNHIRYGLLNVDGWSSQISSILALKILEFDLGSENRETLRIQFESILQTLIDELEVLMEARTTGHFSGVKRWIAGFAVDMDQLRDSVPSFAGRVLDELDRPATRVVLQHYLSEKLDEFTASTQSMNSTQGKEAVLAFYDCNNPTRCRNMLKARIEENRKETGRLILIILAGALLIYALLLPGTGKKGALPVLILVLTSLCLLLTGVSSPMIDLDARIDELRFLLMGEEVRFGDNIIFFQSKSITNMVGLLIRDGAPEMILTGVLIFCFSIVFPALKLISTLLYTLDRPKLSQSPLLQFFVFKSGKWSMADVMVVAIFMAYIGFNGIVGSQLDHFSEAALPVEILTTNGTRLLGAFYIFLAYCLSGLALSEAIRHKSG